jgi:hypothetical protein
MSILEDYEKRCGREPLTSDQVFETVEATERFLERADVTTAVEGARAMVWLHDRLQAVLEGLANPVVPVKARCAYCLRAAGGTDEAWRALPAMDMDAAFAHSQECEHNPLVLRVRELQAQLEELRGRKLNNGGVDSEAWEMYEHTRKLLESTKAAVRDLLEQEMPAEELRRHLRVLSR